MASFAEVSNNKVVNTIIGDSKEELETIFQRTFIEFDESNPAGLGWDYDPSTGKFSDPTPVGE